MIRHSHTQCQIQIIFDNKIFFSGCLLYTSSESSFCAQSPSRPCLSVRIHPDPESERSPKGKHRDGSATQGTLGIQGDVSLKGDKGCTIEGNLWFVAHAGLNLNHILLPSGIKLEFYWSPYCLDYGWETGKSIWRINCFHFCQIAIEYTDY